MKALLTAIAACLMLTACGEFNTIERSSNEVLGTLQPYLSEEDQATLDQLAENFEAPITIRENILNGSSVEIEILGNVAQLEIVNNGQIAFRINGRDVTFDDLGKSEILEEIIMNSLMHIAGGSSVAAQLLPNQRAEAFFGGPILSTVFRLVVSGIYNYTMSQIDPGLGQVIAPIVNPIVDNITGGNSSGNNNQNTGSGNWLGNIIGAVVGAITGNTGGNVSNPTQPTEPQQPTQPQQPACNTLFCGLLNLFTAVVFN